MKQCSACARRTDESGRFCPDCGAALIEDASRPATTDRLPEAAHAAAADAARALAQRGTRAGALGAHLDAVNIEGDGAKHGPGASAEKLIGLTIDGQFEIQAILGGGAFGTVYKGRQIGLDRPVAIKVPTFEIAADPVMAKRFAREARSAARIAHPGVVAIYGVGELADGRPYLAMQLVDGEPLDRILADGPLPPIRALQIARAIASALSETHAADVVHRDLKPTNIMWRRDRNGDDRITLVDFGIAVCKPGNADATRLTSNGLIGTPHYMSPEQAHGELVDARADLYALGCLLFELVTGEPPFEGSGFEVLLAHLGRPAPLPSSQNPDVPECIDRLCAALMQKKPDDRPQHADELVALIDNALADLETGRPSRTRRGVAAASRAAKPTRPPKPARSVATRFDIPEGTELPGRRRISRNLLALGVGIAALAGAGFAVRHHLRDRPSAAVAEAPQDDIAFGGSDSTNDPLVGRRKILTKDNGELIAQLLVPDPLVATQEIRARLDLKNKLGQPVVAEELVLTIGDESGAAKGLTAQPRRRRTQQPPETVEARSTTSQPSRTSSAPSPTPGRFYFRYTFPKPGHYTLRVFPPNVDSSFEIPIDVE